MKWPSECKWAGAWRGNVGLEAPAMQMVLVFFLSAFNQLVILKQVIPIFVFFSLSYFDGFGQRYRAVSPLPEDF